MKKFIKRDDILAIINLKSISEDNQNYLERKINERLVIGDISLDTLIVTDNCCYMAEPSPRFAMKKLNKALYLKLEERDEK